MAAKGYLTQVPTEMKKFICAHAGDPTSNIVPDFEGQFCYDTTNNKMYLAVGVTNADWELITSS